MTAFDNYEWLAKVLGQSCKNVKDTS